MPLTDQTSRILKITAIVIALIIAIPLIVAIFVEKDFSVERDILIERPVDEVFDYVRYLENQNYYSAWSMLDPDMQQEYYGIDGTQGFIYAWEGNDDVGKGEQEIIRIRDGERIDYTLRFYEPFESEADVYMITEPSGEHQTRVVWGFDSRMPYPMNLMLLFIDMEDLIGKDYDTGLYNLKELLEADTTGLN